MDLGHPDGRGTPVLAVQGGTVERVLEDATAPRAFAGYGNAVVINHGDGTWALYAHQDRTLVEPGQVVTPGQQIGAMGNSTNGKFRGMGVHLHLELRRAKADGSSPFPGPYRTYNLDPRPWLEGKGLRFGSRGAFEVEPGSSMSKTAALWRGLGDSINQPVKIALRGLGQLDEYEPPVFDRDVRFGLSRMEWTVVGIGAFVVVMGTMAGVALLAGGRK
jgi:hypothetical protein